MYINSTFQEGSLLLSKMAMFTSEITKVLERNPTTAPLFIGCFAADRIPTSIGRYPHCMVVNLDRAANRGSHWIAIFRPTAAVAKSPDRVVSDFIRDKIFDEYK
jgi:hypothetical protein